MAKAIKYFAIDANGVEHTRSSARKYTHTVVYQRSKEVDMAGATSPEWSKQDGKNYDYYANCVAAGRHESLMHFEHYRNDAARQAADVEEAKAKLGGETRADHVARLQAERVAAVERRDYSKWHNAGWCGRLDLAQKLAAQYGPCAVILTVSIK